MIGHFVCHVKTSESFKSGLNIEICQKINSDAL